MKVLEWLVKVLKWLGGFFCGIAGHDDNVQFGREFGRGRIYLKCDRCGRGTKGWIWEVRQVRPGIRGQAELLHFPKSRSAGG